MTWTSASRALLLISLAGATVQGCTAGVAPTLAPVFSATLPPGAGDTVFIVSDAWAPRTGSTFELFALGASSPATRLTFGTPSQSLGATPSRDRSRVALRRVSADTNRDGRLDDSDRVSLLLVDLAKQIEGPFLPDGWTTSSADWATDGTFLIHTSSPDSSGDDLYQIDANAQNNQRILFTPDVRERGARINPAVTRVVYERIDGLNAGKSEIWIFTSSASQTKITDGGAPGGLLAGTLYLVGSDAGPDYSPDGASVVFRRLTSNSVAGGAWDILTVPVAGGTPRLLASGPQFRSTPDWSKDGIVFSETNLATGATDVVVIDPSTGARTVLQSFASGYKAGAPRWIAGITS